MDEIFFVLRTGCQWNALNDTGICSSSLAHRRFQEWAEAGVFERFWQEGLLAYDALKGIDWTWLSLDGAMAKAPLGGEKTGPNPTDRGKRGVKKILSMLRKITLEWVMQTDGSRAIVFDTSTWAILEQVACDQGKDVRHMISGAIAQCLGPVMMDNDILNRIPDND